MTLGNIAYLALVIGSLVAFTVTVMWASYITSTPRRTLRNEQAEPHAPAAALAPARG